VIVALTAILIYLPTLRFGFVYDDDIQVLDNPAIGSWKYLAAYFLKPIAGFYPGLASAHYYRPVFFLWLRLNYFLFQKQAWGWHLTNTLLHAAVCVLVLKVLRNYFSQSKWSFFGTLLFAVHPAHVETVAWVSGCTDALLALGLFGSFCFWLKDNDSSSILAKSCSMACFGVARADSRSLCGEFPSR
jgi:Gpi18-like mannosyltransferase